MVMRDVPLKVALNMVKVAIVCAFVACLHFHVDSQSINGVQRGRLDMNINVQFTIVHEGAMEEGDAILDGRIIFC
jgi:hypothetical protein